MNLTHMCTYIPDTKPLNKQVWRTFPVTTQLPQVGNEG